MNKSDDKSLSIRNSTAEFLIFTASASEDSIEVRYMDENVWLTQKMMATLYGVTIPTINEHIKNIFASDEQDKKATVRKFRIVQTEGRRKVERTPDHYNLELVIAVGYRVNSTRATQFRKWATGVIKTYSIQGYVLDKKRLENGNYLGKDYFEKLLHEIREIRLSERKFYQKITDIYATALDYDKSSATTKQLFATVQNKLHYAIHGETAAELIKNRADSKKRRMGLQTWENAPDGKIQKYDVSVAKNYLSQKELKSLERIVTMYLDYAEYQAERNIPMTMEDWANRLNVFLSMNQHEVLDSPGKVSAEVAKTFAESEFEKYRIVQDTLFVSDFDRMVEQVREDE
jgi:hypothetical protein